MYPTPAPISAESLLRLFAVWGLGIAGIPADLDDAVTVTPVLVVAADRCDDLR